MQITKITSPAETKAPAAHRLTDKQLYDEINYHRAEKLTKKMLEKGLITADEYDRILAETRKRISDCERRRVNEKDNHN